MKPLSRRDIAWMEANKINIQPYIKPALASFGALFGVGLFIAYGAGILVGSSPSTYDSQEAASSTARKPQLLPISSPEERVEEHKVKSKK